MRRQERIKSQSSPWTASSSSRTSAEQLSNTVKTTGATPSAASSRAPASAGTADADSTAGVDYSNGTLTYTEIGEQTLIREHVTMNPGTEGGGLLTQVGDRCLFMMGSHVAHDCIIGDHVILANNATLGGHVVVEDEAMVLEMSRRMLAR